MSCLSKHMSAVFPKLPYSWNHFLYVISVAQFSVHHTLRKAVFQARQQPLLFRPCWSLCPHIPPLFPSTLMSGSSGLLMAASRRQPVSLFSCRGPCSPFLCVGLSPSFFPFFFPRSSFLLTLYSGPSLKMQPWHSTLKEVFSDTLSQRSRYFPQFCSKDACVTLQN